MNKKFLLRLGGIVALIALLEIVPAVGLVDERSVPRVSTIASDLAARVQTPEFWIVFFQTLQTWLSGLAIASVAGVILGLFIGSIPLVQRYLATTIEFLRPIPSVALIPLAILLLGTGMQSTLLIVVYASFWPILLQAIYGVQDVDPVLRDTAKMFRFRPFSVAYEVSWKTALPYIVTGMRLAASISLILTLTGEMLIGTPGLGQVLARAQQSASVVGVYSIVVIAGVLGVTANLVTRALERRVLHWHTSVRAEQ
ncbi:MAG: ABC transporter permease [Microbacterium ginsengisoli]|nr:ABC transporter permease [Microbacterium ginsengisoli]